MQVDIGQRLALGGEITYKVLNSDGTVAEESLIPYHNDVLDRFWTVLNTLNGFNRVSAKVGTSNAATTSNMVTLAAPYTLLSGSAPYNSLTDSQYVSLKDVPHKEAVEGRAAYVLTYAIGQLNGTFTEIGIDFSNGATVGNNITMRIVGFPGITVNATQQLVITYNFKAAISVKSQTTSVNASLYGVSTPIQVTALRQVASYGGIFTTPTYSSVTAYDYKANWAVGTSDNARYKSIAGGGVLNTPPAGYIDGWKTTVALTEANFVTGIAAIRISGAAVYHFTPAVIKDGDSQLTFGVRYKYLPVDAGTQAALLSAYDTTLPVLDFKADKTTGKITELTGKAVLEDGDRYLCGEVHGLEAVLQPHWDGRMLRWLLQSYMRLNKNMCSFEFIFFYSNYSSNGRCSLYAIGAMEFGDSQTTGGASPYYAEFTSGNVAQSGLLDTSGNRTLATTAVGQWCRMVVHRTDTTLITYVNGVQTSSFTPTGTVTATGYDNRIGMIGHILSAVTNEPQALLLHRVRVFNDYLVPPSDPLPTINTRPSVRTMWLETFSAGLPTSTATRRYGIDGTITHLPTGGPSGIPAIQFTAGAKLYIADLGIQFLPTDEFTLEFDILIPSAPTSSVTLFGMGCDLGNVADSGVQINSSSQVVLTSSGGVSTGTTAAMTLSTWANIVIVRRNESGSMVTYVCRNGVIGNKVTNTGTAGASRYLASGYLSIGGNRGSSPNLAWSLANVRLTRGVIEYFNPAGFTAPTGLKVEL